MSRRGALRQQNNRGAAMIMVLSILAVLLAFSAALLLAASSSIGIVRNRVVDERCRTLAASFSKQLENAVTDPLIAGQILTTGEASDSSGQPHIQQYLRTSITQSGKRICADIPGNYDGTGDTLIERSQAWELYDEENSGDFNMDTYARVYPISYAQEMDGYYPHITVSMYYYANSTTLDQDLKEAQDQAVDNPAYPLDAGFAGCDLELYVVVTCTEGERSQTLRKKFDLEVQLNTEQTGTQWIWQSGGAS